MKNNKIIVLSLGGSVIIPKEGFNIDFLKLFKNTVLKFVDKGYKFIIVCGGGQTCRSYQKAAKDLARRPSLRATAEGLNKLTSDDVDWIGIYATWLNACLIKSVFKGQAHSEIINNPVKKIIWKKPILVAGGWKPGFSTDYDAVKLAELYGIKKVVNLSDIGYIYNKNPKKFKDAEKIKKISWADFRKLIGERWVPGANLPFDPVASKIAQKLSLTLYFVEGTNLAEVEKAIIGEKFKGTVIY